MNQYDFQERLEWSQGYMRDLNIKSILIHNIPAAVDVILASKEEDFNGIDYWCERKKPLRPLAVDTKIRAIDPIIQYGKDDLALEIWSVTERGKPGWTRDQSKQTDYVLWLFTESLRWVLIPFPMLCQIFINKWQEWADIFQTATQSSGDWHSECVFVPRKVIWRELYLLFSGESHLFSEVPA